MNNSNMVQLSFIIPVYNVEKYLQECIDSLLRVQSINIEVVLINDGSSDSSGIIADQYAAKDNRVKVIHQFNKGLSATRNRGIHESQGEYIAFIDSDDWIFDGKIEEVYHEAKNHQVDIAMGNMLFCYSNGTIINPFHSIPNFLIHTLLHGKKCFVELIKIEKYFPMVCNYIYRRDWITKHRLHFKNIVHEDELWMPIALCLAEKVIITHIDFYGYRQQRDASIMNSLKLQQHVSALICIANQLIIFSDNFSFSDSDLEVKSQLFAQAYNLYARSFRSLLKLQDSSYIFPVHFLHLIHKKGKTLTPDCERTCLAYYKNSMKNLKQYFCKRYSYNLPHKCFGDELLILIYNIPWDNYFQLSKYNSISKISITLDRKYVKKANLIVFYLPTLYQDLVENIEKMDEQYWIAWDVCGESISLANSNSEIQQLFDAFFSCNLKANEPNLNIQQKFIEELFFNIQKLLSI